jgi:acyl-CoA reductase-like NAD-dependent aldehyde dehydrogenase
VGVCRAAGGGAVGVNVNDTTELQAALGGWKRSGLGHERGREGLMAYLQPQHLRMRVRSVGCAWLHRSASRLPSD